MRWDVDRAEILSTAQNVNDDTAYEIDLESSTRDTIYQFQYWMSDAVNHDFFVFKQQSVNPVKCHLIVDTTTELSYGEVSVEIGGGSDDDLEDLCMEFQAKRFAKNCGGEDPSQRVIIRSQPDVLRHLPNL